MKPAIKMLITLAYESLGKIQFPISNKCAYVDE